MGIIIDLFLYWLTTWVLRWDEIETHGGDRTMFVPFEEQGTPANNVQSEGKADCHSHDFSGVVDS